MSNLSLPPAATAARFVEETSGTRIRARTLRRGLLTVSRSRARVVSAGVIGVLAFSAGANMASAAAPQPPTPSSSVTKSGVASPTPTLTPQMAAQQSKQAKLLPIATDLEGQARNAGSGIGGVRIDVAAGTVHVYKTAKGRSLQLPAHVPTGVNVDVEPAQFSRAAMLATTNDVTHDADVLGQQHVSVQSVGPSMDGAGINISVLVDGNDADAQLRHASALLHQRYGDIVHSVSATEHKSTSHDLYWSGWRFNDYAPWYGGDGVLSSAGGYCTTGFSAVYNSAPVMLTAAHCGGVGSAFGNGPRNNGSYDAMGSSVYSNSSTDVAAISVSSTTNTINIGSALAPTEMNVSGWRSPIWGQYLCQSGSYTGEVCGLMVLDTNQQQCVTWYLGSCIAWQGPLADVINSAGSGSYAAGKGDSGGPVYSRDASSLFAKGLMHGQLTDIAKNAYPAYYPDNLWCPSPAGWSQRCSSGFSFAHMPGY